VVLPVFNEADTITSLVRSLVAAMKQTGIVWEVVMVDDGSDDRTIDSLKALIKAHPEQVRVVRHPHNRGNGAALRSGIRVARGEVVITMDADGQHDPSDIPSLLRHMPPNDLVIGERKSSYAGPWQRKFANRFYNLFASYLSQREVRDLTSGFRAMRREAVLHFLPLFPEGFSAPTTTTLSFLKAGYNVAFVPVDVGPRAGGESKIRPWRDGVRFISLILRMIMLYDPLRIFLPIGAGMFALGVLAWAAGIWNAERLVFPNSAIFLFSSALMTWLLGLVSEQVSNAQVHYHGDETLIVMDLDEETSRAREEA
jgi:glycosyltransferase involved in cell wall biosynthesis